ncbi:hypothetical protein, partial [Neoroseomonas soli]|uniref:hypothetical protein n=1 Tax=Neoroseomonas soli TaxID=1081025 RepID=UPI001BA513B0
MGRPADGTRILFSPRFGGSKGLKPLAGGQGGRALLFFLLAALTLPPAHAQPSREAIQDARRAAEAERAAAADAARLAQEAAELERGLARQRVA